MCSICPVLCVFWCVMSPSIPPGYQYRLREFFKYSWSNRQTATHDGNIHALLPTSLLTIYTSGSQDQCAQLRHHQRMLHHTASPVSLLCAHYHTLPYQRHRATVPCALPRSRTRLGRQGCVPHKFSLPVRTRCDMQPSPPVRLRGWLLRSCCFRKCHGSSDARDILRRIVDLGSECALR